MNMPIVSGVITPRKIMMAPPPQDDMGAFMNTFEQTPTIPADEETWEVWATRNKVNTRRVLDESEMMISFLGLSSFLKLDGNRVDLIASTYDVGCYNHGGEVEYLDFLQFILSQS